MQKLEQWKNKVICGDCRELLKELPDDCIDCCITSPPYIERAEWGLRDYGTATWEGGNIECDHKGKPMATKAGFNERYFGRPPVETDKQSECLEFYKDVCGKCGAKRIDAQIGLEKTPEEYVKELTEVFMEVRRVLKPEGVMFLNLGDSYMGSGQDSGKQGREISQSICGASRLVGEASPFHKPPTSLKHASLKPKDLVGIPWRVAFSLQAAGWYLRQDIIWHKPNPMPESVTDRCTKAHEYVFLMSKNGRYYYDNEAIKEKSKDPESFIGRRPRNVGTMDSIDPKHYAYHGNIGPDGKLTSGQKYEKRNKRSVWTVNTHPEAHKFGAHFATFPNELITPMIKAGCPEFVCQKCGKPRVAEYESKGYHFPEKDATDKQCEAGVRIASYKSGPDYAKFRQENPITLKGYSDCGCQAGFKGGIILDPFMGAGTTAYTAKHLGRQFIGFELNPEYCKIINHRTAQKVLWECPDTAILTN
jgi:DNA modification methylase